MDSLDVNASKGTRRRRLIVYSSSDRANLACQHLTETWGDRFMIEEVKLSSTLQSCKTSSIDVQLVYSSGNYVIYPATTEDGTEFRTALKKVNGM